MNGDPSAGIGADEGSRAEGLHGLSLFLDLERQARQADGFQSLAFVMVNETLQLLPYRQALLCRLLPGGRTRIEAVSGVRAPDGDAPFITWMRRLTKNLRRHGPLNEPRRMDGDDLPAALRDGWREWSPGHALWLPLNDPGGQPLGGLWLLREGAWGDAECALLARLADAYGHAWNALEGGRRGRFLRGLQAAPLWRWSWRILLVVILIGLARLPVPLSALAPARVTPVDPTRVSAPLEGVIERFHVRPNQSVRVGQPLFELDDTTLRNHHQVAQKALAVVEAEYRNVRQKAFADARSKGDLLLLQARVREKAAEVAHLAERLRQTVIHAQAAGTVLFNDVDDWLGKPVAVGEKILTIADPAIGELEIELPVADAINLEMDAEVALFLNTAPTRPLRARLRHADYEARVTAEGVLAFRLKARFIDDRPPPRLGLRGTAKIYGQRVSLGYYLLRRPLAALRRLTGL